MIVKELEKAKSKIRSASRLITGPVFDASKKDLYLEKAVDCRNSLNELISQLENR